MPELFNLTVGRPLSLTSGGNVTAVTGFASVGATSNLFTAQPGEVVAVPTGASSLILDLGAVTTLRQIALMYTSLVTGDTVRARASLSADGVTSPVCDSGAVAVDALGLLRPDGYRHWFFHNAAGTFAARYIRIDVSVSAARTAGLLLVLNPLQLEYNVDFGSTSWGYEEADDGEILDSGVEVLVERTAAPVLNFTATWVSEAELAAGWEELSRLQHEGVPVLVARRPDVHTARHNGLYYGRLRMIPVVAAEYDMFEVQGRIRSMI